MMFEQFMSFLFGGLLGAALGAIIAPKDKRVHYAVAAFSIVGFSSVLIYLNWKPNEYWIYIGGTNNTTKGEELSRKDRALTSLTRVPEGRLTVTVVKKGLVIRSEPTNTRSNTVSGELPINKTLQITGKVEYEPVSEEDFSYQVWAEVDPSTIQDVLQAGGELASESATSSPMVSPTRSPDLGLITKSPSPESVEKSRPTARKPPIVPSPDPVFAARPTTPQKSEPEVVARPTTPQKSEPEVVARPTTPQKSEPIVVAGPTTTPSPNLVGKPDPKTTPEKMRVEVGQRLIYLRQGVHESNGRSRNRDGEYWIPMLDGGNGRTFEMHFSLRDEGEGTFFLDRLDAPDPDMELRDQGDNTLRGVKHDIYLKFARRGSD